jgi:multimeric flavodoxin WrbA
LKILAINGSPRRKWNTATLLENALEGAASRGAETKLVHLYDLDFKGCLSCFACKEKGGSNFGRCAVDDDLAPVIGEILDADGLILGSPIYFGYACGEMRCFLERFLYPFLTYERDAQSLFPKRISTAWVFTMNVSENMAKEMGYDKVFKAHKDLLERFIGPCETLMGYDTLQYDDYSKYAAGRFDAAAKRKRHQEVFPEDCRKAFELGAKMAG